MKRPLTGRVALVTGATRGAGRGTACELGAAGATVYCTGRGIWVQVDHTQEDQVVALLARIRAEHGRLDILINDVWGGDRLTEWGKPFWELTLGRGFKLLERGVHSHIITSRHSVPLMLGGERGLLVEVTDGDERMNRDYRGNLFYDLAKISPMRLAMAMAHELRETPITALAVTPGYLRSEAILDHFGVREENWRDAIARDPHFAASETPFYVGRAIAALAADPGVQRFAGETLSSWRLAKEYGFDDVDGARPDWGSYMQEHILAP